MSKKFYLTGTTILILLAASSLLVIQKVYAATPKGTHDGANNSTCTTTGWAYDPDSSSSSISIDIYRDGGAGSGVSLGRFAANVSRQDVNTAFGISGNHGFNVSLSSKLSDGKSHSLYVYAIDSSGTGTNPLISNSPKTIQCAAPAPTLTVSVDPPSINLGESITFRWTPTDATKCTGGRGGDYSPSGGSERYTPPSLPYTYSMTCTGSGGSSGLKSDTVTQKATQPPITVKPEVFLNTDKSTITSGDSIKLSWSVRNTPNSCWASGSWSGDNKTIPANNAWASETLTPSGTGTKRYSFTCSNSAGQSNTASVDVMVNPKPVEPTPGVPVPLNVTGNDGPITKIAGQPITLNWGVANVTSWSIMSDTDPNFSRSGSAVGSIPLYGSATFIPPAPPSGTSSVSYIYKIIGVGSKVIDSVEVIVQLPGGGGGGGGAIPLKLQCNDTEDNDGDGKVDYPTDPGCSSISDNDEGDVVPLPSCGDGICNGSENSSSCPADCGVGPPKPQCDDGLDNDSDGKTDMDDPGCSSKDDDNETDPLPPVINDFWAENGSGSSSNCTIDASPKLLVMPKNTSKLTWSCDRIIIGCTLNDNNPKIPDTGAVDSSGSLNTPPINATTTFTLKCPGVGNIPPVTIRLFSPFLKEIIPQ